MWDSRARACAVALHRWYRPRHGVWESTGWWNSANALTALVDYMAISGDDSYRPVIERTFLHAPRRRPRGTFVNEYFDDTAWWGLAWLGAHQLTGDQRYLDTASATFGHMVTGWDQTFGGGVWWRTARDYKNAIANELFGLLAARLHTRTGRPEYLDWALREWTWFTGCGMIGPSGLVNDGLTNEGRNNGGTTWTYNQGVVLGFLTELHAATSDRSYLDAGSRLADAARRSLTTDGVLVEPGTGEPDGDRVQFKGIFARNLRALAAATDLPWYRDFVLANATSAWDRARSDADEIGYRWEGPFDQADAGRQASALDLLNAAMSAGSVSLFRLLPLLFLWPSRQVDVPSPAITSGAYLVSSSSASRSWTAGPARERRHGDA